MPRPTPDELRRSIAAHQEEMNKLMEGLRATYTADDLKRFGELFADYLMVGSRLQDAADQLDSEDAKAQSD